MRNMFFYFLLFIPTLAFSQSLVEKQLFELPDVVFSKIETPEGYQSAYKLMIKQPLDHNNESAGHFYQKVYLSHKGYDKPMALITNGYQKNRNTVTEIASITDANQLQVEHRYFGESVPDSMDYQHLHLENVAKDLHKIRTLFAEIYPQKWISTGISKGGQTTIFYKYFFPNDVDVSIPYVAPLNYEFEDKRIYQFLSKIGTDDCRAKMLAYQKSMLQQTDEVMEPLKWYVKGRELKFNYLSLGEAYEFAVLELPFSFWQWGQSCEKIPEATADLETRLNYLLNVLGLDFFSDRDMDAYASHYYQAATQMGYYGYETADFKGMLKYLDDSKNPHAAFVPNKMQVKFDGKLTNKVAKWLAKEGNDMIYINGAIDTWSATAVPPSDKVNSHFFYLEGKHHANARVRNMSATERAAFDTALKAMLE